MEENGGLGEDSELVKDFDEIVEIEPPSGNWWVRCWFNGDVPDGFETGGRPPAQHKMELKVFYS